MKLLVDMNLSPQWVSALEAAGHDARHWSAVGNACATDSEIMAWARANGHAVLTHDLDFTTILALTLADGPSVVQIRNQDVLPSSIENVVLRALRDHDAAILSGAIVTVDRIAARVRVLPIR